MSEQLLTVLKLCLLALLYLFFLRVLRAVWTEVNPPRRLVEAAPAATKGRRAAAPRAARQRSRRGAPSPPTRLVVVEPADRAGTEYALGEELTLGRAGGCSIVLDEQYVSQVHARVFIRDGSLFVEDLGSTNGTFLGNQKVEDPVELRHGERIRIGATTLELRA